MIIFDLEWNRGYDNKALDEILQIGAVRVERLGGRIVDTFDVCVHPKIHKKLNKVSQELPAIQRARDSTLDFPTVMRRFVEWCGDDHNFAAWGADDILVLQHNCAHWGVPTLRIGRLYDLQALFSTMLGVGHALSLESAMQYCGLPAPFCYHDALNDAVYTAVVGEVMGAQSLLLEPLAYGTMERRGVEKKPSRRRRRKDKPEETKGILRPEARQEMLAGFADTESGKPKTYGPMQNMRDILNAFPARRPTCPVCGRRRTIQQWYTQDWSHFYHAITCPEHGKFLCRLSLYMPHENSGWMGALQLRKPTTKELAAFDAALRFQPYKCKTNQQKAAAKPEKKSSKQKSTT